MGSLGLGGLGMSGLGMMNPMMMVHHKHIKPTPRPTSFSLSPSSSLTSPHLLS